MKTLGFIQKTFKVFQILVKIAKILCVVGAVLFGVGALCAVTQYHGWTVFIMLGKRGKFFSDETDLLQKYMEFLSVTFILNAEAIFFGFAHIYLKSGQTDGTPFTEKGAERLKKLGIRFIYIPIIVVAISEAVAVWQGVEIVGAVCNFSSVVTGIVLILTSLVFRYGAELESKDRTKTVGYGDISADKRVDASRKLPFKISEDKQNGKNRTLHVLNYLCKNTEEALYQFIKRVRLERSAFKLKIEKDKSITEIGENIGYFSTNYETAFKKH